MNSGVRNQFSGRMTQIRPGAVHDEMTLTLANGAEVVALVPHAQEAALALTVGQAAVALVKPSTVMVLTDPAGMRFSARNQFQGRLSRVLAGAINSEVVLDVAGVGEIAAIVTNACCQSLDLQCGQAAAVVFTSSSVLLGVAA